MPRTCSRMKVSASPKPASGPVRGLTWPILIARDCALAGMARSTAGAATAPMPTLTSVRRESGRDDESFMITSLDFSRVAFARLFQMLHDLGPQRRLLLGRPFAKPFAALETELAEPPAEGRLDHGIDRLGVADAVLDQRDRLAPQRMLQPVADEAGHVLLHMHRRLADRTVQFHR